MANSTDHPRHRKPEPEKFFGKARQLLDDAAERTRRAVLDLRSPLRAGTDTRPPRRQRTRPVRRPPEPERPGYDRRRDSQPALPPPHQRPDDGTEENSPAQTAAAVEHRLASAVRRWIAVHGDTFQETGHVRSRPESDYRGRHRRPGSHATVRPRRTERTAEEELGSSPLVRPYLRLAERDL